MATAAGKTTMAGWRGDGARHEDGDVDDVDGESE